MIGPIVLLIFIVCSIYVQKFRGNVHHVKIKRRFTDHANIMAPVNCLFYMFSKVGNTPYQDLSQFPELEPITSQWQMIRDEALALNNQQRIIASDDLDDLGFNSFFRTGWKRFYLKWYGASLNSANELCPKTAELLSMVPSVKGAMFAMLPPGARLNEHRDPYAGSLRYHLGLSTPNSDECYIDVDGIRHSWRDGQAVMFDETFIHAARNNTEQNRIILFLDIKRPTKFFLVDWFNTFFSKILLAAAATKNVPGDKVGVLNRIFKYGYQVRVLGKKIKEVNVPVYYGVQYSVYLVLIYFIFLRHWLHAS